MKSLSENCKNFVLRFPDQDYLLRAVEAHKKLNQGLYTQLDEKHQLAYELVFWRSLALGGLQYDLIRFEQKRLLELRSQLAAGHKLYASALLVAPADHPKRAQFEESQILLLEWITNCNARMREFWLLDKEIERQKDFCQQLLRLIM